MRKRLSMKPKHHKHITPRFLYCPWQVGPTLTVLRNLIVKETPKRITIQLAPYDGLSEEFRRTRPVVLVDRQELDRLGWFWKWKDNAVGPDPRCPLGSLYRTEEAARLALDLWVRTALDAVEVNPASLN